jgi:phospholipid/cholesterol/gamma-HCH transport system substrate-binding protein
MKRFAGLLIALALLGGAAVAYTVSGQGPATYTVTADVDQAPNLFEGGRVMVRGIEVGRITDVEPRPDGVRLTMEIQEGIKIPADADLAVIPVTVISDRYIQFFPAYSGGPALGSGDHIPISRTSIPAELDDVLTQLQGLLEALEPRGDQEKGSLARLVDSLDQVFANRSDDLAGTLEGGATVLENLADSDQDLTGLIQNLDQLFLSLANRSSEIGIVNERFQLVAEALLADQENLEGTIENLTFLSDQTAQVLNSSGDQIGSSFKRLSRVLSTLLRNQNDLKRGIQWSNVIAQTLGATDSSGKGIYAYTGRQAPPGTAGSEYNYRIDSRDTNSCERLQNVADTVTAVTPLADYADILETALSYIPDPYDDDLSFLIEQLILECVVLDPSPSIDTQVTEQLRAISDEVGEDVFLDFVGRWLVESVQGDAP